MNETNKFKDKNGDAIQAIHWLDGVLFSMSGQAELTPDQAIEFAKQLTELAQEVKAKQ